MLCVSVSPQACTLLLTVLFVYDVFFVFITPFLTRVRRVSLSFVVCLCLCHVRGTLTPCVCVCGSTERREYNGEGSGWSRRLCHSREGGLVYKCHGFPLSSGEGHADACLLYRAASHGAQGAEAQLLPSVPVRPALLAAGLWRHPGAR